MNDTIAAVATSMASGAGINIIRISGENALRIMKSIFSSRKLTDDPEPNKMYLGTVKGKNFSEKAFCVYCKSPFSYTGEDVVEVHCHGGKGVTSAILRLVRENGARPAEPGEFTKRAFLNGKMTLAEAEGVLDMINASSEIQVRNAYAMMNGEVTMGITKAEEELIKTASLLEAKLDYPEELEEEARTEGRNGMEKAISLIENVLRKASRRKTVTDGVDVVIAGTPNAGKSSLLNALLGQERAIVSDEAGTTRDVVKESVDIDGVRFNFLDTAGIRQEGAGKVEKIGIEKSLNAIESAYLTIAVLDTSVEESEEERNIVEKLKGKRAIYVGNKSDNALFPRGEIAVSAKTGDGMEKLTDKLLSCVGREEIYSEGIITNERHIYALEEALEQLKDGLNGYDMLPTECVLENIRNALGALGKITGKNVGESVVNEIFARFCVGK